MVSMRCVAHVERNSLHDHEPPHNNAYVFLKVHTAMGKCACVNRAAPMSGGNSLGTCGGVCPQAGCALLSLDLSKRPAKELSALQWHGHAGESECMTVDGHNLAVFV